MKKMGVQFFGLPYVSENFGHPLVWLE